MQDHSKLVSVNWIKRIEFCSILYQWSYTSISQVVFIKN